MRRYTYGMLVVLYQKELKYKGGKGLLHGHSPCPLKK